MATNSNAITFEINYLLHFFPFKCKQALKIISGTLSFSTNQPPQLFNFSVVHSELKVLIRVEHNETTNLMLTVNPKPGLYGGKNLVLTTLRFNWFNR